MADVVPPEVRSRMMAGIRGKDTKLEVATRKALHALGFRYRMNDKKLPGKPDIVLPKYKAAIFVHGCFWHGHDCSLFRLPATRQDFWRKKIDSNKLRDARVIGEILDSGWRALTIWECACRGSDSIGLEMAVRETADWIRHGPACKEIRGRSDGR